MESLIIKEKIKPGNFIKKYITGGDYMEYSLYWQKVKDYRGNTEEKFENSKNKKYLERRKREIEKTLEENCSAWIEDYSSEIYEEEYQENEKGDL